MPRRIVMFIKNRENPNYLAMLVGARRIAEAAGAELVWRTTAKPDDPVEQAELLRQTIAERPDGLIFAPADDRAMDGPVAKANAVGIPIVGFVNRMPGRYRCFIGADDVAMARIAAGALIAALGGRGRIVLIEGPSSAPTARDRGQGFREAIAAAPGIRLLATAPGFYHRQGGLEAMRGHLAAHAQIDGVIATNDAMALGAADACAEAGRRPLIVGNNGTIEAAAAVRDGRLYATMDYDGFKMGVIAAEAMLRLLDGRPVPLEILMPTTVIDRANCARWLIPVEQRPTPTWAEIVG